MQKKTALILKTENIHEPIDNNCYLGI